LNKLYTATGESSVEVLTILRNFYLLQMVASQGYGFKVSYDQAVINELNRRGFTEEESRWASQFIHN
jgi:hypothetical protein